MVLWDTISVGEESFAYVKNATNSGDISEISTAIAAAVEQQAPATQEISMNVHQAAAGTSQVAEHIVEVNASANNTGDVAKSVMELADGIADRSKLLLNEANRFLASVRSGRRAPRPRRAVTKNVRDVGPACRRFPARVPA